MAKKIVVDPNRALFYASELDIRGYNDDQAARARIWIIYGDWKYRGSDPTLEMSDFFPDDEQYLATLHRINQRPQSQNGLNQRSMTEFEQYMQEYKQNDGFMHA